MQKPTEAAKSHPVSIMEAFGELERETQVRSRCYDKWQEDGKVSWSDARDRMARIGAAVALFRQLIEHEPAILKDYCKDLKISTTELAG